MTSTPASFASDFEVHANPGASTAIPSTSAGHGSLYTALFAKPGSRSQSGAVTPGSDVADKGRHYMLTADDEEIRRILQTRLDREAAGKAPLHAGIRFRDLVFTKRFTTFDRQNPLSAESPFHGFFTLFWLAIALLLLRVAAQNWRLYGSFLGKAEILHIMFDRDIVVLGLTDAVMVASTVVAYGLQKLIQHGYLSWRRSGWIIQNVWQSFFLGATIAWTLYREWPWTHTIFIVLHCLVFVMKQHSYAFYNGYRMHISLYSPLRGS
jgi:sterol O-acyltransferase